MSIRNIDSFTNVDVNALNEEEKEELRRIRKKVESQRQYRERKPKQHICIRYNLWFYTFILIIASLFMFSVVFSATRIRYLGLKPPSCVVSEDRNRLPFSINPLDYQVRMKMNFSSRTFEGKVDIILLPMDNTYCFFFHHSSSIKVNRFFVMDRKASDEKTRAMEIRTTNYDEKTEIFQAQTREYLHKGREYKLHISYSGVINEYNLEGLYVSFYEHKGKTNEVFSTHFESSAARSVFPCFDEPFFKSRFTILIDIPKTTFSTQESFKVISNTPIQEIAELGRGDRRFVFETTPLMSTYLVAFAMGPLQSSQYHNISVIVNNNVNLPDTEFILHIAFDIVNALSDYFDYNYYNDMKKLDLLGLTNFRAGAMENWGLITFRESLLITPKNASIRAIRRNAEVTAHEIAHQWVGNLVTPKWWSDIFLNEAAATFFQYLAVDLVRPEWNVWNDFPVSTIPAAMDKDAYPSSPSLLFPVEEVLQILSKFDVITYNKGGSILRMLWDFMGHDNFRGWFREFLSPHFHSNSNHTEFLETLYPYIVKNYKKVVVHSDVMDGKKLSDEERRIQDDVRKVSSWYTSNGYPVITIEKIHGSGYKLHQKRFLWTSLNSPPLLEEVSNFVEDPSLYGSHLWWIPIRYFTSSVKKEVHLIEMNEEYLQIEIGRDWFKMNADSVGFYRVNYPKEIWGKLLRSMYYPSMTVLDRVSLIDDAFSLGEAGQVDVGIGLEMSMEVKRRLELKVWKTVHRHLIFLHNLIRLTQSLKFFQNFVNYLSTEIGDKIGWKEIDDDIVSKKYNVDVDTIHELRKIYISQVRIGMNNTIIQEMYYTYKRDLDSIPGYLLYEIGCVLVNTGDIEIVEHFWKKYEESKSTIYLSILGQSYDRVQFTKVLDETLTQNVLSQDGHFVIRGVCSNVHATDYVFDWLRENFGFLSSKFGMTSVVNYILPGLARYYYKIINEKDIEVFFGGFATPRTLKISVEMIQRNRWWYENIHSRISFWLKKNFC